MGIRKWFHNEKKMCHSSEIKGLCLMQSLNEISWNQFHENFLEIDFAKKTPNLKRIVGTFHQTQTLKLGWVVCLHFFHGSAVWEAMILINLDDGSFKKKSLKLFKIFIRNFRLKKKHWLTINRESASTKKLFSYKYTCSALWKVLSPKLANKWKQ